MPGIPAPPCEPTEFRYRGLARDYCVKWTAEDAVAASFIAHVLWDLTRPVMDTGGDERVRASLEAKGVRLLLSE